MATQETHPTQSRLWPTVALCSLVLCGWMAISKGGSEVRADNGGATTAGIIALMGSNLNVEHLFLVNTNKHTIEVYEMRNNNDLSFVAGRSYEYDSDYLTSDSNPGKFLKYNGNGYDKEVGAYVSSILKKK